MASSRVSFTDAARWYCIIFLALLLLVGSFIDQDNNNNNNNDYSWIKQMNSVSANYSCDEIYVVGEGETLHTISDKCGDPFIVEENPHIHDPDDVFPGLVIKITPNSGSRS
ncbi:uncharacterized protein [Rutidosis leptorrhynchoides]|uniref:uncharacterized protein n=1 Tax=Rutidosis leptorrhynchoides TaxID=125765 RepID=UPI003A998769